MERFRFAFAGHSLFRSAMTSRVRPPAGGSSGGWRGVHSMRCDSYCVAVLSQCGYNVALVSQLRQKNKKKIQKIGRAGNRTPVKRTTTVHTNHCTTHPRNLTETTEAAIFALLVSLLEVRRDFRLFWPLFIDCCCPLPKETSTRPKIKPHAASSVVVLKKQKEIIRHRQDLNLRHQR